MPILDYVVPSKALLDRYRAHLNGLALHLVVLAPGREAALQRDRERHDKTVAERWLHLDDVMKLKGVGLWIDNSSVTAKETVDLILKEKSRARL